MLSKRPGNSVATASLALSLLWSVGVVRAGTTAAPSTAATDHTIPHLRAVTEGILCGGEPKGAAGFEALPSIVVRVVCSVDAARPEVEQARAHGMRYAHILLGYDDKSESNQLQLAKAVGKPPGPVYIHCHRRIHRAPTAAALASVLLGKLDPPAAVRFVRYAGTSRDYAGLYRSVERAISMAPSRFASSNIPLPEETHVARIADTMTRLDRVFGRLERIKRTGWTASEDHPDLVLREEAEQASELLRALDIDLTRSDWLWSFGLSWLWRVSTPTT